MAISMNDGSSHESSEREKQAQVSSAAPASLFRRLLKPGTAVRQSGISLIDQGMVSAVNFLTGIIIARSCSKEEFGLYSLGFSLTLVMADLQSSLIMTPYMIHAPRLKAEEHSLYTGSTLLHQVAFCILTMIGLACAALISMRGIGPKGLASILWALIFVVTLLMLREHARRVSFARLQLETAFVFDAFIAIGQVVGLGLLAHYKMLSASRAFWVIGTMCGIAVAGWLWWDRNFYTPRLGQAIRDFKMNWVTGRWLLASGLLWTIGMNLYPWILASMKGVDSTGVWAACMAIVSAGNPVLIGLQNLVGPKIAHEYASHDSRKLKRLVLKLALLIAAPLVLLCICVFFWGGTLLTHLYGNGFAGNGWVMSILCVNVLITGVSFAESRALFAMGRADIDFKVNVAAVLITITAGLWLVHAFGTLGAALGLLGANLATSTLRHVEFMRASAILKSPLAQVEEVIA